MKAIILANHVGLFLLKLLILIIVKRDCFLLCMQHEEGDDLGIKPQTVFFSPILRERASHKTKVRAAGRTT